MSHESEIYNWIKDGIGWFIGTVFTGIFFLVGLYVKKITRLEVQLNEQKQAFEIYKVEQHHEIKSVMDRLSKLQLTLDHLDKNVKVWKNGNEKFLNIVDKLEARISDLE